MWTDPRGPRRTIVSTDNDPQDWFLTLDCGHIGLGVRHHWFEVGGNFHCLSCKKEGNDA